ncbi:extracellular solute-binding protein [Streptomyces sp. NPDC002838]|uniref:extracellular solute-binding protein n=1 Tax=Streptomyces sp. NPDC002838 TaxID=3154436 RepID=UPI0033212AD9
MRSHSITEGITRRSVLGAALSAGAATATAGGLTGCGVSRRRDELFFGFHGDTVSIGVFQEIVRLYRRKYPRRRISYTYADSFGFFQRLPLMFRAGTAPDVMIVAESWVSGLSQLGGYADLTSFMRADGLTEDLWVPGSLNPARIGGEVLCLPLIVYPKGIAYNRTLLAKRGLPIPQPGWRERDFVETAAAVASGDDRVWGIPSSFGIFPYDVATVHGGLPFSVASRTMTATDERMVSAVELISDLIHKHRAMPTGAQSQYAVNFTSGIFGMDLFPGYALTALRQQIGTRFEWGVVPYPEEWVGTYQNNNVAIFDGSQRKEEAWHFVTFLSTDPDAQRLLKPIGTPALATSAAEWQRDLAPEDRELPWDQMIQGMAGQLVAYQGGIYNKVWDVLGQKVQAVQHHAVPVREALDEVQERGTEILRA